MAVLQDVHGPDWPHGFIRVVTAGVPVRLTNLVDAGAINAPETPTIAGAREYTSRFNQIIFQGLRPIFKGHGMEWNTGNVYIVRAGGDRDDPGSIVAIIGPGQTLIWTAPKSVKDVFSLYRYWVDADHDWDGVLVTGLIF